MREITLAYKQNSFSKQLVTNWFVVSSEIAREQSQHGTTADLAVPNNLIFIKIAINRHYIR